MPTEQEVVEKWRELRERNGTMIPEDLTDLLKWAGVKIDQPRTVWDEAEDSLRAKQWGDCRIILDDLRAAGFTLSKADKEG